MSRKNSRRKQALEQRQSESEKYQAQLDSIMNRLEKEDLLKSVEVALKEKREKVARKLSIATDEIETLKERIV